MDTRTPAPAREPARRLLFGLRGRRACGSERYRCWLWLLACLTLVGAPPSLGTAEEESLEETEFALHKPLASRSLLLDGVAVDGLLVAVGERGHILFSRDQGMSWQQATVPTRATLTGVFFHDSELGWAVGHDAVILRSRDGGESWELLHQAPEEERPFLDVWFEDVDRGFAIGAYSFFLETTDGGDTWSSFEFDAADLQSGGGLEEEEEDEGYEDYEDYDDYELAVEYHLNHLAQSDDGRLYIAAEAGTIYRSDDAGGTWISLPSPYEGSFFGTLPLTGDSLLLFGLRGHLYRSDDAGATWQPIETGTTAMLTNALILQDGTILVGGLAGTVLVSRDGGHTFVSRPRADRQGLAKILQIDDGSLILIGDYGVTRLPLEALDEGSAP